jgi:hypothetical protein
MGKMMNTLMLYIHISCRMLSKPDGPHGWVSQLVRKRFASEGNSVSPAPETNLSSVKSRVASASLTSKRRSTVGGEHLCGSW